MIYTVTLNPAIDYVVFVDEFKTGCLNRMERSTADIGGKGINVSVVLSELGEKTKALGFAAGFTGAEIEQRLQQRGIMTDFVLLPEGISRINIKLKSRNDGGVTETEINSDGPEITDEAMKHLYEKLSHIADGDCLVLAGSVPGSLGKNTYEHIMEYIASKDVKVVVDAAGELLTNTLKYKPFLIKPNLEELAEIFGEHPASAFEAADYARHLQEMGAQNVLVSMADKGALLLDESGEMHFCKACEGKAINSVGAGDAMLAGFLSGILDSDTDGEYALMLGTAAGAATAFSEGLAARDDILMLLKDILMEKN